MIAEVGMDILVLRFMGLYIPICPYTLLQIVRLDVEESKVSPTGQQPRPQLAQATRGIMPQRT
jgi:hypothetical protein